MSAALKSVLMISTKLDPHVDAVLERLEKRGVPCFRLNTDHFHEEYRLAINGGQRRELGGGSVGGGR